MTTTGMVLQRQTNFNRQAGLLAQRFNRYQLQRLSREVRLNANRHLARPLAQKC